MSTPEEGHFTFHTDFPPDVIAVTAHGHIGRKDYERDLVPKVLERIRAEGKVKLLYEIGADFKGISAGAAWDDAELGLMHLTEFARIAVVTDVEWLRLGTKMFAPILPCPVHLFHLSERNAARDWICADGNEREHRPGVAADHKIPPLEDRIPPEA